MQQFVWHISVKKIKTFRKYEGFLEGYQSIFPLYEDEILARSNDLFKTVSISYNVCLRKTIFPSNTYLTISEKPTGILDYLKKLDVDSCINIGFKMPNNDY